MISIDTGDIGLEVALSISEVCLARDLNLIWIAFVVWITTNTPLTLISDEDFDNYNNSYLVFTDFSYF